MSNPLEPSSTKSIVDGTSTVDTGALTDNELKLLNRLFGSPLEFPVAFKAWLKSWLTANPPTIPVTQLQGFTQYVLKAAPLIAATETTNSNGIVDLITAGPEIDGLPNGTYLVLFGCDAGTDTSGFHAHMRLVINGTNSAANEVTSGELNGITSVSTSRTIDLTEGSNTIKAQYRSESPAVATFANRWLTVLKTANL